MADKQSRGAQVARSDTDSLLFDVYEEVSNGLTLDNSAFFFRNSSRADVFRAAPVKFYDMAETLQLRGTLVGHSGWVTQIATNPKFPDTILSSSRGKYRDFVKIF